MRILVIEQAPQIELPDDEAEGYHGNSRAYPSKNVRSLAA
jgi:hypothetical protein